jgi:hypothetical protein
MRAFTIAAVLSALACAAPAGLAQPTVTLTEEGYFNFPAGARPAFPEGRPLVDAHGDVYGVSYYGGGACDCGYVFKLTPLAAGKRYAQTKLHIFAHDAGGSNPGVGPVMDAQGNVFGTTSGGGKSGNAAVIYELSPPATAGEAWAFTAIATIANSGIGNLTLDAAGNLYFGNPGNAFFGVTPGVFRLNRPAPGAPKWKWTLETLTTFAGGNDGSGFIGTVRLLDPANPAAGIYGATQGDGSSANPGTIWHLTPPPGGGAPWKRVNDVVLNSPAGPVQPQDGVWPVTANGVLYLVGTGGNGSGDPTCKCGAIFSYDTATAKMIELYNFTTNPNGAVIDTVVALTASPGYLIFGQSFTGGKYGHGGLWALQAVPGTPEAGASPALVSSGDFYYVDPNAEDQVVDYLVYASGKRDLEILKSSSGAYTPRAPGGFVRFLAQGLPD